MACRILPYLTSAEAPPLLFNVPLGRSRSTLRVSLGKRAFVLPAGPGWATRRLPRIGDDDLKPPVCALWFESTRLNGPFRNARRCRGSLSFVIAE